MVALQIIPVIKRMLHTQYSGPTIRRVAVAPLIELSDQPLKTDSILERYNL